MSCEGPQQFGADEDILYDPERPAMDPGEAGGDDASGQSKPRRQYRSWLEIGRWDPTSETDDHIKAEILRIAREKMQEGGIEHIKHLKSHESDLGHWKERDHHTSGNISIVRYRCPLSCRCKCNALLKVEYGPSRTIMFMSDMHTPASHEQDQARYLKWQQKQEVVKAVQVLPLVSAKQIQRNLHRTSPEKQIDPELKR